MVCMHVCSFRIHLTCVVTLISELQRNPTQAVHEELKRLQEGGGGRKNLGTTAKADRPHKQVEALQ